MCEWECDVAAVVMSGRGAKFRSFYYGTSRWISSLYLSHRNHYSPVSHHCLLSISVNGSLHLEQYLSDHIADKIQSDWSSQCSNLVLSLTVMCPVKLKIVVLALRTRAKGCRAESCHAGTVCRPWILIVIMNSPFTWKSHCIADEHFKGFFILYARAESDLHNYVLCILQ